MDYLINSERLVIRGFERGDKEAFVRFMTDPESTRFLAFGEEQKSRQGATELLEATISSYDSPAPLLAFAVAERVSKEFVGFCGLTPRGEDTVEIMYAVMPKARGQGYATEMTAALARHALDQFGYGRVTAPIAPRHEASKAVALKAGFRDQGLVRDSDSGKMVHLFVFEPDQRP